MKSALAERPSTPPPTPANALLLTPTLMVLSASAAPNLASGTTPPNPVSSALMDQSEMSQPNNARPAHLIDQLFQMVNVLPAPLELTTAQLAKFVSNAQPIPLLLQIQANVLSRLIIPRPLLRALSELLIILYSRDVFAHLRSPSMTVMFVLLARPLIIGTKLQELAYSVLMDQSTVLFPTGASNVP